MHFFYKVCTYSVFKKDRRTKVSRCCFFEMFWRFLQYFYSKLFFLFWAMCCSLITSQEV